MHILGVCWQDHICNCPLVHTLVPLSRLQDSPSLDILSGHLQPPSLSCSTEAYLRHLHAPLHTIELAKVKTCFVDESKVHVLCGRVQGTRALWTSPHKKDAGVRTATSQYQVKDRHPWRVNVTGLADNAVQLMNELSIIIYYLSLYHLQSFIFIFCPRNVCN